MISPSTLQEIKERANLLELVGETTKVRRQGVAFVALCPFHNEDTPSFHIRERDNTFHCFGCGEGGDVISFIMKSRGLSFYEAVSDLAGRLGIEIRSEKGFSFNPDGNRKGKLFEINELTQQFFREQLRQSPRAVKEYVVSRKLGGPSIDRFGIGFAPQGRDTLIRVLRAKGIADELMLEAGVVKRGSSGDLYDTFQGRLQFPIYVDHKRIAGFGGRVIPALFDAERTPPKYLNSSETLLYKKSKILYGLPQALPHIREKGEVYVVEGYMDVVGLAQAGVGNVIAACGTAFGEGHIKRVSQLSKRVILLFDGDHAGRTAAARSFELFLNSPIDVWALFLPEGEDPDSCASRYGDRTGDYLSSLPRVSLLDVYIDSLMMQYTGSVAGNLGAASKAALASEVMALVGRVENGIIREELTHQVERRLKVERERLTHLATEGTKMPIVRTEERDEDLPPAESHVPPVSELEAVDRELLSCLMVLKSELPKRVLQDSELCGVVNPAVLSFAQLLLAIMQDEEQGEEVKRDSIRRLLLSRGSSWVQWWKRSYQLSGDKDVDMRRSFEHCCFVLRRKHLSKLQGELDKMMQESESMEEKLKLSHEKVSIVRRLQALKIPE